MRHLAAAAIAAALLFPLSATASCGSSSCPLDLNSLNHPAIGGFTLDLSLQYIDQDRLRGSSAIAPDHLERRTLNRTASLLLEYAASERLQLSASMPYLSRLHEHDDDRVHLSGPGDLLLQARGRIVNHVWLIGGVKLPAGRHDQDAEVPLLPGTGSTDVIGGVAFESGTVRSTPVQGSMGNAALIPLFASLTYRRNGRGVHDYRVGNEWQLNAGTAYPVAHDVELLLQANARRRDRDVSPESDEDAFFTGGTFVFASPGVRVTRGRGAWYALVQVPVVQRVNATQLTARVNYVTGVQMRF